MKKILLLLTVFLVASKMNSQSFIGYTGDNYSGVHAVVYNPASIVDSNFKTDINLFSASFVGANDLYSVNISELMKDTYDISSQSTQYPKLTNNFIVNSDILGPSFMLNIAPKHSIAIFSRSRVVLNINGINGELIDQFSNDFNANKDFNLNTGKFNVSASSWAEVGFAYATILLNKEKHFLKGGFSFKYLQGAVNSYINANNATVAYQYNGINTTLNNLSTSGTLTYGGNLDFEKDLDKFNLNAGSKGFGLDFGFIYEYRPEDKKNNANKYLVKAGFSVTDIGSINYVGGFQKNYNLNKTITEAQFLNAGSIKELLDNNYSVISNGVPTKSYLPTAVHLNLDWNFIGKLYLNMNSDFRMNSSTDVNKSTIANLFSITPRFETKWLTVYVPMSYMDYRGVQTGFGFRFGPLFLGSSSVISNLIGKESKGADVHLGLKIPIYRKTKKLNNTATVVNAAN
jgi:hypothetical protein